MLACRSAVCASFMVPCSCRSVASVPPHHLKGDQLSWDFQSVRDRVNAPFEEVLRVPWHFLSGALTPSERRKHERLRRGVGTCVSPSLNDGPNILRNRYRTP